MGESCRTTAANSLGASRRSAQRVVHLTTVHHPLDPRIFHKQLKTLQKAGYDVHLVVPRARSEIVEGIPIVALPEVKGRHRRVMLQRKAYQAARKLDADVYHFHDPELIPVGFLLKRATAARMIYDMHEDYRWHGAVEGRLLRMLERWCFQWVDHVLLAEEGYHPIVAGTGVESTFIGNFVRPPEDETTTQSEIQRKSPFQLLYTGIIAEKRGLLHMVDLMEGLVAADGGAALDMVGICHHPDQRCRAERTIRERNLEAYIRRVGWKTYVPSSTMTPYYREAHVGLALFDPDPNYTKSIPTKFYEYLHFGLPILCSDFPRWRAFIEQHDCGAVVPPGDVEAALTVLRRWQEDPDRYRALSKAAQAAAPQYRWAAMGERLVRVYDELLDVERATG